METKRIIVADPDDSERRELISNLQEGRAKRDPNLDMIIDKVGTAEELIRYVTDYSSAPEYHAVIINLPPRAREYQSGIHAIKQIRRAGETMPIYVFCYGVIRVGELALRCGATKVFDKPYLQREQIELVNDLLSHLSQK